LLLALLGPAAPASRAAAQSEASWPLHGLDLAARRYSPLTAIDTVTVTRLKPL
jgi:glucose dehydrogenase